jgi:voltage-gated potassium channel
MRHGAMVARWRRMPADRRHALRSLLRSLLLATAIVLAYAVLPMNRFDGASALRLCIGLIAVATLLGWQIREISRSPFPWVRAVETLSTTLSMFFAVFATTYYVMSSANTDNFSEPLSRLDSAYFTVTVFATVGFGDIVATTEAARSAVLLQMLSDLVLVGLVAHAVVNAVRVGKERQGRR